MATPYIGEIRLVGFNFAPEGWAICDGSLLSIAENEALFNLIGTIYGGDGQETFALPDLRGRVPVHAGTSSFGTPFVEGELGGSEAVTLTTNQLPSHQHGLSAVAANQVATSHLGSTNTPTAATVSAQAVDSLRQPARMFSVGGTTTLAPITPTGTTQPDGGSQPHENRQPYLAALYIISLFGVYPSQN